MGVLLGGKHLTRWEFLDSFNTFLENRGPEIFYVQDLLGSSQPEEMTTIISRVATIQDDFNIFMCKTTLQYRINTTRV